MVQKILGAQRDFSYGQIDVALKRNDDHPARKAGLRQMRNMRILNPGSIQNRPGRSALFVAPALNSRIEDVTMLPGQTFKLVFYFSGSGKIDIVNSVGTTVKTFNNQASTANFPWLADQVSQIVYAVLNLSIYITFPGMRPQIITWDGGSNWSLTAWNETINGGQKRTVFYRLSPQGITMFPSGQTGTINLVASAAVFTPASVGTRISFINRQILITGYTDPLHATGLVEESLPGAQVIGFGVDPRTTFSVGDIVVGSQSGSIGIVVSTAVADIGVQLTTSSTSTDAVGTVIAFRASEFVAGPGGALQASSVTAIGNPAAVTFWDDEVMNDMRGYPASCFVDQYRLGFCNFPSIPGGIGWSAINAPNDFYVQQTQPDNAIFEIVPEKVQVYFVVPGVESSEFIFCDRRIYYIPINAQNPLKPGSVAFQILSNDGSALVQPRASQEFITYVPAGNGSVLAITAPGAYYRPFSVKEISEFHTELFGEIVALAIPTATGTFQERYAYALNATGDVLVGKYQVKDGQIDGSVGWGPWSGMGQVQWVSASQANVIFSTQYFNSSICEILDDTRYLDSSMSVNNAPAALTPPFGEGPLWFAAGQQVFLMDQVTRNMGVYQVDANGFIVPQFRGGENLASSSLIAGQNWTAIAEPFCPDATPGADVGQRMFKRRISRFAAYVIDSTGFLMARLFSGPITPTSPPLGTVMNQFRVPAYNQGDNSLLPPPLREEAQRWRPLGRSFDPRVAIIKDTPGPLLIAELGMEATI